MTGPGRAARLSELSPAQQALVRARLRARSAPVAAPVAASVPARPRPDRLPLSPLQARMFQQYQADPASPGANVGYSLRLHGPLDVEAIRWALGRVVARHEILRTRYAQDDQGPYQLIRPDGEPVDLVFVDGAGGPGDELAVADLEASLMGTPFDLTAGSPLRAALVRRHADDHQLILTIHHIATDGYSMGRLATELVTLYEAGRTARTDPLPPLPRQYADYALWLLDGLDRGDFAGHRAYWAEQVRDLPAVDLPGKRGAPATPGGPGAVEVLRLSPALYAAMSALGRSRGAPLFPVLLAGLSVALARRGGRQDIVIGSPFSNRTRAEWEPLIGLLASTLPLRIRLRPGMTGVEVLDRAAEVVRAAHGFQTYPLPEIARLAAPDGDPSPPPPFQVSLTLQNRPSRLAVPPLAVEASSLSTGQAGRIDLSLFACEADRGGFEMLALYASDRYEAESIRALLDDLRATLERLVAAPDSTVDISQSTVDIPEGAA